RVVQYGLQYWLKLPRRPADDPQNLRGGGLLLQRLMQFLGEPRDFRVPVGRRGTATDAGLRRIATLGHYRLAMSRFKGFAACFGEPPHVLPELGDPSILASTSGHKTRNLRLAKLLSCLPAALSSPPPASTPIRRMRSPCCARAASGHAAAPPMSVMN